MATWIETTQQRYWDMLEILPPAAMTGRGFLVGEPQNHNERGVPRYTAFIEADGRYFEAVEPMTVAEFHNGSKLGWDRPSITKGG